MVKVSDDYTFEYESLLTRADTGEEVLDADQHFFNNHSGEMVKSTDYRSNFLRTLRDMVYEGKNVDRIKQYALEHFHKYYNFD